MPPERINMSERVDGRGGLPRGERIHNRNALATVRRTGTPEEVRNVESMVSAVRISARQRQIDRTERSRIENYFQQLKDIDTKLLDEKNLSPYDQAELRIKKIWCQYKSGQLTMGEKEEALFTFLSRSSDIILKWLDEPIRQDDFGNPITRLASIRDKVILPLRR